MAQSAEPTEETFESTFEKYRNPDPRCIHPFTPDMHGYCWSFAGHVDGARGYEDIEAICRGCGLFDESRKEGS